MSTILLHMVWPQCEFRMQVWNVLQAARWKYRTQKIRYLGTITQLCPAISSQRRHVSTIGKKNMLNSNTSSTCPHNMANFGPITAEIDSGVWGTTANFNGFRILAALLHGILVLGIRQTAALNPGHHLYSAGRPARWALAHILVIALFGSDQQFCYCEPLEICLNCTHWGKILINSVPMLALLHQVSPCLMRCVTPAEQKKKLMVINNVNMKCSSWQTRKAKQIVLLHPQR